MKWHESITDFSAKLSVPSNLKPFSMLRIFCSECFGASVKIGNRMRGFWLSRCFTPSRSDNTATGRSPSELPMPSPAFLSCFLLLSAAFVYVQNIAVFVAFYWRFYHPCQQRVADGEQTHPGILFPHSTMQMKSLEGWRPAVIDYAFLSFNTSSTFGPTLPVPLRGSIQLGMMLQVAVAMTVLVMLAARAIGLIG